MGQVPKYRCTQKNLLIHLTGTRLALAGAGMVEIVDRGSLVSIARVTMYLFCTARGGPRVAVGRWVWIDSRACSKRKCFFWREK